MYINKEINKNKKNCLTKLHLKVNRRKLNNKNKFNKITQHKFTFKIHYL